MRNGIAEQAAMRERNGTRNSETRTGEETIEAERDYRFGKTPASSRVMDLATLKEQADRCRRLAKHADPFTQKRLLDLASEHDARIAKLEPQPSAASRMLRNAEP
jgi:hypothetical protein